MAFASSICCLCRHSIVTKRSPNIAVYACGHLFHKDCLKRANTEMDRCMVCYRTDFIAIREQYEKLYEEQNPTAKKGKKAAAQVEGSDEEEGDEYGMKRSNSDGGAMYADFNQEEEEDDQKFQKLMLTRKLE